MSSDATSQMPAQAAAPHAGAAVLASKPSLARDLLDLSKPRLTGLLLISTWFGYVLAGGHGGADRAGGVGYVAMLLGFTFLLSAGCQYLNQYIERNSDKLMVRTANRPLATGRVAPQVALIIGVAAGTLGVGGMFAFINPLAGWLSLLVWVSYVLIYTPLKRVSILNTQVGAVPGSIPALLGWAAAAGTLGQYAGTLFLVQFVWQFPHTLSIAWMYKDDYKRAGLRMITVDDPGNQRTNRQLLLYSVLLVLVSLLPTLVGMTGPWYFMGALASGVWFLFAVRNMMKAPSYAAAKRLLKTTVFHLPLLFLLMYLDSRLVPYVAP